MKFRKNYKEKNLELIIINLKIRFKLKLNNELQRHVLGVKLLKKALNLKKLNGRKNRVYSSIDQITISKLVLTHDSTVFKHSNKWFT